MRKILMIPQCGNVFLYVGASGCCGGGVPTAYDWPADCQLWRTADRLRNRPPQQGDQPAAKHAVPQSSRWKRRHTGIPLHDVYSENKPLQIGIFFNTYSIPVSVTITKQRNRFLMILINYIITIISVSDPDPNPDPHSMDSWIRIQKGENQHIKEEKLSQKTRKKYEN
jgi:hypothetical protein